MPHSYSVLERFVEECFQGGIISKPLRDLCPSRYLLYYKEVLVLGLEAGSYNVGMTGWYRDQGRWRNRKSRVGTYVRKVSLLESPAACLSAAADEVLPLCSALLICLAESSAVLRWKIQF